jgi:hypothetical protein
MSAAFSMYPLAPGKKIPKRILLKLCPKMLVLPNAQEADALLVGAAPEALQA